jgi:hypothetical protein
VFAVLGSLGALVTIFTAIMFYFGWRRSEVQAHEMGIDVSLFDFSAQDYVLRSISSLYLPLLVIFGAALVWFVFHGKFVVTLRRLKTAQSSVQRRSARRFRVVGITATALAVACVLFSLATGLSSPPWPIEPIADALFDHQWVVPATLIFATVTATYAFWARRQLPDSSHSNGSPWQAAVTGAIIASTLALAGFWMLEEYSSAVGLRYANQIADSIESLPRASIVSRTPLGIQGDGVREEVVQALGSTYYRTTGLRLLARSGGKVLLLPDGWTLGQGTVVVITDRDDLVWQFSQSAA